jgi:FtsP/CotA-like multicopper oxidase with cupredoxin domain
MCPSLFSPCGNERTKDKIPDTFPLALSKNTTPFTANFTIAKTLEIMTVGISSECSEEEIIFMGRQPKRRHFLKSFASASALLAINASLPSWVKGAAVMQSGSADIGAPLVFDLAIREQTFGIAGGLGNAMTVNDTIPGPLLEWYEGRDVVLKMTNNMRHSTSIHWHGILLPFEMDGVPGADFQGIDPGETFRYQFPVKQSGTYWYHSHTRLQEQSGVYGPLVIHPKDEESVDCDRDYVVMLTDWTFENPHDVIAKLKKSSLEQNAHDAHGHADVNGSTNTHLMHGLYPAGNLTGIFNADERVRLRFICVVCE